MYVRDLFFQSDQLGDHGQKVLFVNLMVVLTLGYELNDGELFGRV
jgi:hypothetical protein